MILFPVFACNEIVIWNSTFGKCQRATLRKMPSNKHYIPKKIILKSE